MLEELVAPISDEAPCGEYLKDNRTIYRGYRNAFNMAQSSFRQLVEDPEALNDSTLVEANANNWMALSNECAECLKTVSKDLEILCWHAVAQLFSQDPLANLLSSLQTFEHLVENYWDQLHPMVAEDKLKSDSDDGKKREWAEGRIKPLVQLVGDTAESGLLYMPLQMQTLVSDIDYTSFFGAEKSGRLASLKEKAMAALGAERGDVTERVLTLGHIHQTLVSIEQKISANCNKVGAQAISFRFVKDSIDRLLKALRYLVGDGLPRWPLDPEEVAAPVTEAAAEQTVPTTDGASATPIESPASTATQTAPVAGVAMVSAGAVASREQALQELQKIANYFLEAEPHSPIYMLLKRAIRWGGMSLPDLLEELVGDNASVQSRISQLAGLESASETPIKTTNNTMSQTAQPAISAMPVQAAPKAPAKETKAETPANTGGLSGIEW